MKYELTARRLKVWRQHKPLDTGSLSYFSRLMYHAHSGLIFLTNQLYQRWDRSDTSFILRPSLVGMTFGALTHRVCATHKGDDSQRWVYVPYVDTGNESYRSTNQDALRKGTHKTLRCCLLEKLSFEHFPTRVIVRPPNTELRNAAMIRTPVKLTWSDTKCEDQKRQHAAEHAPAR